MLSFSFRAKSPADLLPAARKVVELCEDFSVFLLEGDMGAGKTTFTGIICKELGAQEPISSPSFSIVNEYICGNRKVFHFDLYRIQNENELMDIGFEEYIDSGKICFIEWPERGRYALEGLPAVRILFRVENEERLITIEIPEQ